MSTTDTLRDALFDDLNGYTAYTLRPRQILTLPTDESEFRKPAISLATGAGGRSEREELGPGTQLVVQQFNLVLWVDGNNPVQELDNLLDDVRNLLEVTTGTLISSNSSTYGVEDVNVISWSEPLTGEGIAAGVYFRVVTVEVRYVHRRGSA